MDISTYTSWFHDGSITGIEHSNGNLIVSMKSAEVFPEEIKNKELLSEDNRIHGRLHIDNVQSLEIDEKAFLEEWKIEYDSGGIFDFEITKDHVLLMIQWVNFPPKNEIEEFSVVRIRCKNLLWEPIQASE